MKRSRADNLLRGASVVLTAATLAWGGFALHGRTEPNEYTNYLQRLQTALASNAILDEEIVRITGGAVKDFEGVDRAVGTFQADIARLRQMPSFLRRDERDALTGQLDSLATEDLDDSALTLKVQRVERIKTQNARLRSVAFDLAAHAGDLAEALRKPQPARSADVDLITREIITYSTVGDAHIANRISAEVNELSSYVDDPSLAPWREQLDSLIREATFIIEAKPKLDGLTETTLSDPRIVDALREMIGDLQGAYGDARSRDARRAELFVALLIASIVAIAASIIRTVLAQREEIRREHDRAEALLLNILPSPIAEQLKAHPDEIIAKDYPDVSVLFADIVGFTPLASRMSAVELVQFLNRVFSAFDRLAAKHGLEKIKTLGDAYMVASGLPEPRADHAEAMARMALDMQQEILQFRKEAGEQFGMRIGINSGPVVAGVIGLRKFIYDLWGDAVNVASRMESHGVPNAIHCSDSTYRHLVGKGFRFQERGVIPVKGKGEMKTWLLVGREEAQAPAPARKAAAGS